MNQGSTACSIKGMIPFPCCEKEKIIAYEGSSGKSSIKCPRCGKYAVFDYDKMTATPGTTMKGVTRRIIKVNK